MNATSAVAAVLVGLGTCSDVGSATDAAPPPARIEAAEASHATPASASPATRLGPADLAPVSAPPRDPVPEARGAAASAGAPEPAPVAAPPAPDPELAFPAAPIPELEASGAAPVAPVEPVERAPEEGRSVSVEERDWENAEEIAFAIRPALRGADSYVVKPGDTLMSIAQARYGDRSRADDIYAANRDQIGNPDRIYPGQTLELP